VETKSHQIAKVSNSSDGWDPSFSLGIKHHGTRVKLR